MLIIKCQVNHTSTPLLIQYSGAHAQKYIQTNAYTQVHTHEHAHNSTPLLIQYSGAHVYTHKHTLMISDAYTEVHTSNHTHISAHT